MGSPILVLVSNRRPSPPLVERILVIRLGALGDVVRTLPALHVLRDGYPEARISWLSEAAAAPALAAQPAIDEVLVFPREALSESLRPLRLPALVRLAADFVRDLRGRDFELVLDFHGILKSGLLAWLSGAQERVGYAAPYAREGAWVFANQRVKLSEFPVSRFERNLALVRYLGLENEPPAHPLAPAQRGDPGRRPDEGSAEAPILAHPGSSAGAAYKRYPARLLGEALATLHARTGRPCRVLAGDGEHALAEEVVSVAGAGTSLAPGTSTFAELLAEVAQAALFISGDTGPLHVASLAGTPVVQILGPTHPIENAPSAGTPSRTLRVDLSCSPCRRGCAAASCMRLVSPLEVARAGIELLEASVP